MSKKDPLSVYFESQLLADEETSFKLSHEIMSSKVPVIQTGSPSLDDALSSGGLPKGRLIQYYGPPSSGKTLMSMLAIREAQKDNPKALQLFIDSEGSFDPKWAAQLGADPKRIALLQNDLAVNGRRCFATLLGVPKADAKTHEYKGKTKDGFLDKIAKGEKGFNFNLIVLDSLGALIPPGDDVAVVGKITMAKLAKFLTQELKKVSLEVSKAKIPFIMINHKRDNLDPYGIDHTFAGGNAYAHHLSANVYFEMVARKDSFILDANDNKIGGMVRATVEKSKFGPHPRKCEFKVDFRKGVIDTHEEIANLALKYNIVKKTSNMSYEYGNQKWVGKPKLVTSLMDESFSAELAGRIEEARDAEREVILANQEKTTEEVIEASTEE